MKSTLKHLQRGFVVAALVGATGMAQAAIITLTGVNFNVNYDNTKLGLFGVPTLGANDTLFFTLNSFSAQSLNGASAQLTASTISGIELVAKGTYQFGSLKLVEFGDYQLQGAGSTVAVTGQLRAFNASISGTTGNAITTQTTKGLTVSPTTPLNLNDGINHDWFATSTINGSTAPVVPTFLNGVNALNSVNTTTGTRVLGVAVENILTAFTPPVGNPFIQQAFIEKKFAGVQIAVSPVPEAPSPMLMVGGLALMGFVLRKKCTG